MPEAATNASDANSHSVLQLKIRLLDISPMIWRRVLIPAATTLRDLHGIFQVTTGWEGLHLYQFRIHAVHYGSWELGVRSPDPALGGFSFRAADKFVYTYDLISGWQHEIRVEAWRERQPHKSYPVCIGGSGACPPEDCGGPPGYAARKTEALGLDAHEDLGVEQASRVYGAHGINTSVGSIPHTLDGMLRDLFDAWYPRPAADDDNRSGQADAA